MGSVKLEKYLPHRIRHQTTLGGRYTRSEWPKIFMGRCARFRTLAGLLNAFEATAGPCGVYAESGFFVAKLRHASNASMNSSILNGLVR